MTLEIRRIKERIAQAERDLEEIEEQVSAGEIDGDTADLLRARYEKERDELRRELVAEPGPDNLDPEEGSFLSGRRIVGAAILTVAAAGLAFGVVQAVGGNEPAAEGVASDVVSGEGVNLDDITNEQMEQVVAENPDIAPMRLALADRYFTDGDFSNALTHYLYVLETLEVQDPSALANVGWMTFLSGEPEVALSFVERSLAVQPDGGIAFWYLANIRFVGLEDAAGAVEPLELLLAYDNLPVELRSEAEEMFVEVRAAL